MSTFKPHGLVRAVCPVLAAVFLAACAGVDPKQTEASRRFLTIENTGDFGARPFIASPEDLHRLSASQIADFRRFMDDPARAHLEKHRRLYEYFAMTVADFRFDGVTLTAEKALASNRGNCLSLAIVTTALAKAADIDIGYQLMDDVPTYELNGVLVEKNVHVRSILYDPDWAREARRLTPVRPGIKIDYFPTNTERFIANIDERNYLAMYYRNIAVEALASGDLNAAYWNAMESFKYEPDNSLAINTLAVINRRAGDLKTAEALYRFGIEHADEKLTLLKNYRLLLTASGRFQEADSIERQLEEIADPSPFHWFHLARSAHDDGDYRRAIRYYRRALKLAPYLHEAYHGIAQSNYEAGRLRLAERALKSALANTSKFSTRQLYQAELATLSRQVDY